MDNPKKQRVLLIGLDGFTWRVGHKMIEQGHMPTLQRLVEKGTSGALHSVIPCETSPAWSSFQTGCYPAKTGIFAFHGFARQAKHIKLNSFQDIRVPTLWELVSEAGKTVVSLNMPMTSPPPKIKGAIIPGLTCPELSKDTVYPEDVYDKYLRNNPDYLIVNNELQPGLQEDVRQATRTENARCDLALRLMNDFDWDLFSIQIQSTDVFQHRNWWALTSDAEGFTDEAYAQAVIFYKHLDQIINKISQAAGESVLTVIVSDHGFCSKKVEISINAWLTQNGYLALDTDTSVSRFDSIKNTLKKTVPGLKPLAEIYGKTLSFLHRQYTSGHKNKSELYSEKVVKHIRETIDLDHTFAFCLGGMAGLLYLLDPKQKDKAHKAIDQLLQSYGPNSPNPLIADIQPINIDSDSQADVSYPNYLITLLPGVEGRISPDGPVVNPGVLKGKQFGTHEQEGVLLLHGTQIKSGMKLNAQIVDIAPTILSLWNIPVPEHIDGHVLTEAFNHAVNVRHRKTSTSKKQNSTYSEQDQYVVEKQLRNLGYL